MIYFLTVILFIEWLMTVWVLAVLMFSAYEKKKPPVSEAAKCIYGNPDCPICPKVKAQAPAWPKDTLGRPLRWQTTYSVAGESEASIYERLKQLDDERRLLCSRLEDKGRREQFSEALEFVPATHSTQTDSRPADHTSQKINQ